MHTLTRGSYWIFALLAAAGCSSPDSTSPTYLWLDTGHESDTWTAAPETVEIAIRQTHLDGSESLFKTIEPPTDDAQVQVSLEGADRGWFTVEGLDSSGRVQVRGSTGLVAPDADLGFPIRVFMARVGRFSRPPSELAESQGLEPPIALLSERFILMAGIPYAYDAAVRIDGYDLSRLGLSSPALIPCSRTSCRTKSLVALDNGLVLMIGDDWAVWANFACGSDCTGDLALPDALEAFSDVAGGKVVRGRDGTRTIVGATRSDEPTRAILLAHPDNWQAAYLHETPRAGAAATWVEERGLLVVGGADDGSGAELWTAEEPYEFNALPYPPDPTRGAGLVAVDGRHVLRVGGILEDSEFAPSVLYDLDCTEQCVPTPFGPPIELSNVDAFHLGSTVLVFGTGADGLNQARLITADGVETIELRQPRRGARALETARGQVVVVGGELEDDEPALTLEIYQD